MSDPIDIMDIAKLLPHRYPEDNKHFTRLKNGTRVFATGDYCEIQGNVLVFKGREEHGKINGQKVYAGEYETFLNEMKAFADVKVVFRRINNQDRPFAYVVPNKGVALDSLRAKIDKKWFGRMRPIFKEVDELPKTTNGKLDTNKLINPPPEGYGKDILPPGVARKCKIDKDSDVYIKLRKIWQDIFPTLNIDDDSVFFDIGGDSEALTLLTNKVKNDLDKTFSTTKVLQIMPLTIRQMFDVIANGHYMSFVSKEEAGLQLLKYNSGESKMFFLPALLGEGFLTYKTFASFIERVLKASGKPLPSIYGLSCPSLYEDDFLPEKMEQLVESMIKAIKREQPEGPYQLVGFSFGATLVYEVAKELKRKGDEVTELHLVDGYPPKLYKELPDKKHAELIHSLLEFLIPILNKKNNGKDLSCIEFSQISSLDKMQQVKTGFAHLRDQVKDEDSKRMLTTAERHLNFILVLLGLATLKVR